MKAWKIIHLLGLMSSMFLATNTSALAQSETREANSDLTETIRTYVEKRGSNLEETNYRFFQIDLNGDNIKDALVLFEGMYFCGNNGCSMAVFQGTKQGYKLISNISLVKEPVIVSETFTEGWRDIIVHVSGGGIIWGQDVALKFNGSTYPSNPSLEEPILPEQIIDGVKVVFNLQTFNVEFASVSTLYPKNMNSDFTCSHGGCGYYFTFKPQNNALDRARMNMFIPSGLT